MADTDHELLEQVAKVVELDWFRHTDNGLWLRSGGIWNALRDDGDALRLAVKLGISITPYPIYNSLQRHSVIAKQRRSLDTMREANPTEVIELYGDDPAAAWRRAIVRCAAKIGRAM